MCCDCCTYVPGFFLAISIIVSNIVIYFYHTKYDYENNQIISEIQNSFNGYLIESIAFRESCEGGEEKLIFGIWDGTIEGCNCAGNIFKKGCSKEQNDNGCVSLFSNPPINYTVFNSSYICAKYSKMKYKELLRTNQVISKGKGCPINYKLCGTLDTLGRQLCVRNDEICPVNTETINNMILGLINENLLFNENKNHLIEFLNENENSADLVASIKISQFMPCINPCEKYWDYHYVLEPDDQRCVTIINGNLYDNRYRRINDLSINKLQLYDENSIINKLSGIDKSCMNKIEKDSLYLYTRNFLGFDVYELEFSEFDYENLISYQKVVNNCFIAELIFAIIFGSGIAIPTALYFFEEIGTENCKLKLEKFSFCFIMIGMITFSLSPFFYIIIYSIIIDYVKGIKSILNLESSDDITYELLKLLIKHNSFNYKYSLAMVIINPFNAIFLITSIRYWAKNISKDEQQS